MTEPATAEDLCYLTGAQALALFKTRKLSPADLLDALIARASRLNPAINCFADTYFEEARAAAKAAEARYQTGEGLRPLEGVPLAVKDAQRVAGKRTTHGSLIFKDNIDGHSDPMIERLQAAGAIVFARSTAPEFCLTGATYSRMWGVTRNPWNLAFTPGGSSGGSGAALAAGLTTLATGTDIGGSIRIPASCSGVVGFKPPHGRNPDGPPACFDRYNHCGPMTRSVADAALMQNVTSGPHPLDHDSLRIRITLPTEPTAIKGMKIAWSMDLGYTEVVPDVRRATLAALDVFRDLGAEVTEVHPGWTRETDRDCMHWYNAMHFARQTVWLRKAHAGEMTDYALKLAEVVARFSSIDDVHKAFERAHAMYQTLGPILENHDVFICPTTNLPAVTADHDPWDKSFTVNGKPADAEYGWVMTHPFNMLNNCPVLAVPSGFAENGVPCGIQIVGRSHDDARVFEAGLAYEQALGGWYSASAKRPTISAK